MKFTYGSSEMIIKFEEEDTNLEIRCATLAVQKLCNELQMYGEVKKNES